MEGLKNINMKPTIIQLEPYGDHRDNKSGMYAETLDWNKIMHNLNLEDCLFILARLYNNILLGEKIASGEAGYDAFSNYRIMKRGSEVWADVDIKDEAGKLDHKSFRMFYDTITHQFSCDLGMNHIHTDGSCYILIYEYFKIKK